MFGSQPHIATPQSVAATDMHAGVWFMTKTLAATRFTVHFLAKG
jgi:hypothetical protein